MPPKKYTSMSCSDDINPVIVLKTASAPTTCGLSSTAEPLSFSFPLRRAPAMLLQADPDLLQQNIQRLKTRQ